MVTEIKHLFPRNIKGVKGLSLILSRGHEEEIFFKEMIRDHSDLFDFTSTGLSRREYFFSEGTSEETILKFLALYNDFGRRVAEKYPEEL